MPRRGLGPLVRRSTLIRCLPTFGGSPEGATPLGHLVNRHQSKGNDIDIATTSGYKESPRVLEIATHRHIKGGMPCRSE
jgi:hypothetical protein